MNFLLYHYIVFIFVSCYLFLAQSVFCLIRVHTDITSTSFWLSCAWSIIFDPFTLSLCLSLELTWVSWRQHVLGSCFLIHPATLCLLIGEFNPFTFRVIINGWGLRTAILSFFLVGLYLHSFFFLVFTPFSFVGFVIFSSVFSFFIFSVSALDLYFVFTLMFLWSVSPIKYFFFCW